MSKFAHFKYDRCGVGNRLFQYVHAKLSCQASGGYKLIQTGIPELNIPSSGLEEAVSVVCDEDTKSTCIWKPQSILQNHSIYKDFLGEIKTWDCFDTIDETNEDDLVIHLRAGNRFLSKNALFSATADVLENALSKIDFKKLHIVTNLKKNTQWTIEDINDHMEYLKTNGGDGEPAEVYQKTYPFLPPEISLKYTNSNVFSYNISFVSYILICLINMM